MRTQAIGHGFLDRYFGITAWGSSKMTEFWAGVSNFSVMAYIIALNPIIISGAVDNSGRGLDFGQLVTVTCLTAGVSSIAMGVIGKVPIVLAPGLGLNAVVAYQLAPQMSWQDAMGLVMLEGLVVLLLVLVGLREAVLNAMPKQLRYMIAAGIGVFIAVIGFVDAGVIRRNPDVANTPVPVGLGENGRLVGWPTVVFVVSLLVIGILWHRNRRTAVLVGIAAGTAVGMAIYYIWDVQPMFGPEGLQNAHGWAQNVPKIPDSVTATPDFGLVGEASLLGAFDAVDVLRALLFAYTLVLTDFFDTLGTFLGVGKRGNLLDKNGNFPNLTRSLAVDAGAAALGGFCSSSSNTSYIESTAGVSVGGKTGLTAVWTGLFFLAAIWFTPIVEIIPNEAAGAALVVIGVMMVRGALIEITENDWMDVPLAMSMFLTLIFMAGTYSITAGIGAGIVAYVGLNLFDRIGRRQLHPLLIGTAVLYLVWFAIDPVEVALGV